MVLFPQYVELKATSLTYPRFEYESSGSRRYCHLKIDIRDGVVVFYCTQLINYQGPEIAGDEGDIRRAAIRALRDEGKLICTRSCTGLARHLSRTLSLQQEQDVIDLLNERSVWIRHYTTETNLWNRDSYGMVFLGHSFVRFTDLETVVEVTGLDRSFFHIDCAELYFEHG